MFYDQLTYMNDDILAKVDRASMATSLEVRVPLLDHRVIEQAWRVPLKYLNKNNIQKWVLKKILSKYIPNKLVHRPKKGFSLPLEEWFRGPLQSWAYSILFSETAINNPYIDKTLLNNIWDEHQTKKADNHRALWNFVVFQLWYTHNIKHIN